MESNSAGAVRQHRWSRLGTVLVAVIAVLAVTASASAQIASLYYREVAKDGKIFVFNTPERFKAWESSGEMGANITIVGHGPNGETVVAENATAIDLYNFKHDLPAYDRPTAAPAKSPEAKLPAVKIGGIGYISYQDGKSGGKDFSKFTVKRMYVDTQAKILPYLSARATLDVHQDSTGDWKPRFKYMYGKFDLGTAGFLSKNYLEFGLAHMPWLDFEEHINNYRLQDPMFMERNGLFNSADVGVLVGGNFGPDMPDSYKKSVNSHYAGQWGSYQIGVYNGTGYHASEANTNKVLEGRITVRPMPGIVPGLQFSFFGVDGKGNTAAQPDWKLASGMVSYESPYVVVTGQYADATGNQAGTAIDSTGSSLKEKGWSGFVEGKLTQQWRVIGRYDQFDPNSSASNDKAKRSIVGVAYKLNSSNLILLDHEEVKYDQPGKPKDQRTQLTLQVAF